MQPCSQVSNHANFKLLGRSWAQHVDKQKLETNYYDRMYKNYNISASLASWHLKIGRERELLKYSVTEWIYFYAEAFTLAMIWLEIEKKRYNEVCENIYRTSLPYKSDSVNTIFHHMLRLGVLLFFFLKKEFLNIDILS